MKKILFSTLLSALICLGASAQEKVNTELSVPNAKASVKWEQTIIDAGQVKQHVPERFVFTFTNTGNAPVVVTRAKGSCGCTGVKYPHEPIKPGETGDVEATYNSKNVGMFNKTVTVTFDFEGSQQVLKLKGEVVTKITKK